MNDLEIQMVLRYIDEYLPEPNGLWTKEAIAERSYSRWAAYEIIHRLTERPFDPPEEVVEMFVLELTGYVLSDAPEAFSAARDAAIDILCILS